MVNQPRKSVDFRLVSSLVFCFSINAMLFCSFVFLTTTTIATSAAASSKVARIPGDILIGGMFPVHKDAPGKPCAVLREDGIPDCLRHKLVNMVPTRTPKKWPIDGQLEPSTSPCQ